MQLLLSFVFVIIPLWTTYNILGCSEKPLWYILFILIDRYHLITMSKGWKTLLCTNLPVIITVSVIRGPSVKLFFLIVGLHLLLLTIQRNTFVTVKQLKGLQPVLLENSEPLASFFLLCTPPHEFNDTSSIRLLLIVVMDRWSWFVFSTLLYDKIYHCKLLARMSERIYYSLSKLDVLIAYSNRSE